VPPQGIVTRRSTEVLAMDDRQLAAGLRFIREHFCHPISTNEAARAGGLSRRVFERRFLASVGRSPRVEIIRLRLERVKELLHETDWALAEIADKTGFRHSEYLHTVFTQKIGLTPGKYRQDVQKRIGKPPGFQSPESLISA
jgi:LacI family transcriptional regulator